MEKETGRPQGTGVAVPCTELYSGCVYSDLPGGPALLERRKAQLENIAGYMYWLFRTTFKNGRRGCMQLTDQNGLITHCEDPRLVGKLVSSTAYSGTQMLDILHKSHYMSVIAYEEVKGERTELFYGLWYVLRDLAGEPFAIIMERTSEPCSEEYKKDFYFCCRNVQSYCEYRMGQQNLIDAIANPVLITGMNGKIRQVNAAMKNCAAGNLIGASVGSLQETEIRTDCTGGPARAVRILGRKVVSDRLMECVDYSGIRQEHVVVLSASEREPLMSGQEKNDSCSSIIGSAPAITAVKNTVRQIARKQVSVLIQGESGTGKELVAKAIHQASGRKGRFVPINCGAMDRNLLYSELFGYEEGAFTGASRGGKKGKIELSDGGTLFLDEIGEMPFDMQVSLLRVLEGRSVMPVGGKSERKVNLRIVAATNRDLKREVDKGNFRADLYFRLAVIPIYLPPLRERREDIPDLTRRFARQIRDDYGIEGIAITDEAMRELAACPWYGNVRELKNSLEYMILMSEDAQITLSLVKNTMKNVAFRPWHTDGAKPQGEEAAAAAGTPEDRDGRREEILRALENCKNNKTKAARSLGISRKTLYIWMMQCGIEY